MQTLELDGRAELRTGAASGLMALTGNPGRAPLCPPGLVRGLDRAAALVAQWSGECGSPVEPDWADLVTARAGVLGLQRRGRVSANGTCRLLRGPDGFMALNLPRPEDRAAVDAVVEGCAGDDPWEAVQGALAGSSVAEIVERARLLGVPAAPLGSGALPDSPWSAHPRWERSGRWSVEQLRVVDLSSMWAGPLAAMLLSSAGAEVVKVESTSRPDGARAAAGFYGSLHSSDQEELTLDFGTGDGRRRLGHLLGQADVVIESSRPRALEQLGAGPDDVERRAGRVWLSITGYGRQAPGRDWVAFGDDAAVAGGLVAWEDEEHPVFCGDALADPVTGLLAAAAVFEAVAGGGGVLLDVSMQACAASVVPAPAVPATAADIDDDGWHVTVDGVRVPVRDRGAEAQPAR